MPVTHCSNWGNPILFPTKIERNSRVLFEKETAARQGFPPNIYQEQMSLPFWIGLEALWCIPLESLGELPLNPKKRASGHLWGDALPVRIQQNGIKSYSMLLILQQLFLVKIDN